MQPDSEQLEPQSPAPSRSSKKPRRRKGRKKENDRKRLDDVKLINFHEHPPRHSFLKDLALQLDRMANGVKSAIVYSYATSIPIKYDPKHAPADLQGNEILLERIRTLYSQRTIRKCPVNYEDEESGQKKRCPYLSRGVGDIIRHQTVDHGRPCYYLCLKSNCLAAFSKICNAKRHVEKIHPEHCYERTTVDEDKKRRKKKRRSAEAGENVVPEERQRQGLRRVREGHVAKRTTHRKSERVRGSQSRTGDNVAATLEITDDVTERIQIPQGMRLKAHSEITLLDNGDIMLTVTPARGDGVDIEAFHSKLLRCGFEEVVPRNEEFMEWVATTALLKIAYQPKKVVYKFTKRRQRDKAKRQ